MTDDRPQTRALLRQMYEDCVKAGLITPKPTPVKSSQEEHIWYDYIPPGYSGSCECGAKYQRGFTTFHLNYCPLYEKG